MRRIDAFRSWCHLHRGYRPSTTARYASNISRWLAWCADHGIRHDRATSAQVHRYLAELDVGAGTWNQMRATLIVWFNFLQRDPNPARGVERRKRREGPPRSLTGAQVAALLTAAHTIGPATRLIVALACYAGLRATEMRTLTWDAWVSPDWLVVVGKGGQIASVPIHPEVTAALRVLQARADRHEPLMFPSPTVAGQPISHSTLAVWWQRAADLAGVPSTPHQGRHSFARALLTSGADVATVQTALRHASLSTTTLYVRAWPEDARQAVSALSYRIDARDQTVTDQQVAEAADG